MFDCSVWARVVITSATGWNLVWFPPTSLVHFRPSSCYVTLFQLTSRIFFRFFPHFLWNKVKYHSRLLSFHSFKVPLWSNSRYLLFYIFVHNRSFLDSLTNFNLLRTLELMFFGPLFFLVPIFGENWRIWRHFLKNTTRVEIIITVSTAICIKSNKNFGSYIRAIF